MVWTHAEPRTRAQRATARERSEHRRDLLETSVIDTHLLPNGLTLVAEQIPGVRSAAFLILLPAGAVTDPIGQEGLATVLEGMVYRGAGERDTRALSDALDALGVQRSGGAELETASFGG